MSWETGYYKADIGLFRELKNTSISGTQYSKGELNGYMQIISTGNTVAQAPGPDINVEGTSGSFGISEIEHGQTRNLFGFALKQNGAFTHKYAVCRCTGDVIITTPGSIGRYYGIKWAVYDETTGTYTDLVTYSVDAGLGTAGQINWNDIKCYCVFKITREIQWGSEQNILYGGVYAYSNDSSNFGSQYVGKRLGMQGIGVKRHLSQYDEVTPEEVVYSPEFGPEAEPGGYVGPGQGSHDKSSEHSGIPTKPQYGFSSAGFLNHYLITSQGLTMLGEALFPEPILQSTGIEEAIDKLTANMWNSKIIDYVLDCRIIPARPHDDGLHNITCGGKVLVNPGTSAIYRAALIDEDFVDVDCGSITTPLVEGNFLDFYQMNCKLFLPFYGYVDIAPEYWNGGTIGVYYRFNMMDGSFMAWVTSGPFASDMEPGDVIGQYAGNACIHLPINSISYSNIIGGMITTGAAIVGTAAGAGVAAGAAGSAAKSASIKAGATGTMLGQAASGAANIINSRPQLNANNSYNGSAALMSKRKPYLLIEFNNPQFSRNYVQENGLPLVVTRQIGDMSGMTVCENAILNFACTEAEQKEILAALQEGVIV